MTSLHIFARAAGEHFAIPSEKTPQSDPHSMSSYRVRDTTKKQMAQNCSKLLSKNGGSSKLFQMVFKKMAFK